jgi:hypothetical protein
MVEAWCPRTKYRETRLDFLFITILGGRESVAILFVEYSVVGFSLCIIQFPYKTLIIFKWGEIHVVSVSAHDINFDVMGL